LELSNEWPTGNKGERSFEVLELYLMGKEISERMKREEWRKKYRVSKKKGGTRPLLPSLLVVRSSDHFY